MDRLVDGNLKISLYAGTVLVAESKDPILWQKVLATITKKALPAPQDQEIFENPSAFEEPPSKAEPKQSSAKNAKSVVGQLADQMGITIEQLEAACAPSTESPYVHLDPQYWESMRKRLSARGPSAVSNIAVVATLLCLWFKKAGLQELPSIPDCQAALKAISPSLMDVNPARSLKNASWLQKRGKGISIDPTEMSKAIEIAKSYCIKGYDAKVAA
jgi:hypothetical protein